MKCPKCKIDMIIDDYNGWRWTCFNCFFTGRQATDKEINEQDK